MSKSESEIQFEEALASENPVESLWKLAVALRDAGISQLDLYFLFEKYYVQMPGDDSRYDAIADTMECIHGGPWAKGGDLYPDPLTNEILQAAKKEEKMR